VTARVTAVAVAFVANGLGGPSFLPRLPERQASLGLSDVGLGLVLAGMAVGALAASPFAGRLVGRTGSRPVVVVAAVVLAVSLWTAGAAPQPVLLFLALVVIGAADATMDIAINANGAAYERRSGRSVLHRLHGAWSLGALAGAGVAAAAATLGVSLTWQLMAVGAAIAGGVLATRSGLVGGDAGDTADGHRAASAEPSVSPTTGDAAGRRVRPGRRVLGPLVVLGAATIGGAVVEGAPADWSAIRLERLGTGPGAAALGFAAFMAGMLAGRAVGDHATDRLGGSAVLRGGMGLVAAGLFAGALVDHPAAFGAGLVVAGVGASGFFPLAFSAAGNTAGVPPGVGAATVSLTARLGFLVEPLIMGAVAELVGLQWAFAAVAAVALGLAAAASRIIPPATRLVEPATVTDVRSC
jgi:MFS family permease